MVYCDKKSLEIIFKKNQMKTSNQKLNKFDKQNLRKVILDSPRQFAQGFDLAKNIIIEGNFDSLCVSGMGGSSLPIDLLRTYIDNLFENNPQKNQPLEIIQNRSYCLPAKTLSEKCLHIFSSYSGNTEETISSLKEAITKKVPFLIGITHGGELQELCAKNNLPCIILPEVIQPRYATGYFFAAILQILINLKLSEDTSKEISISAKKLEKKALERETQGKAIAKKLLGKTPIIYSSDKYKSVAMVWKIKINENSKTPCFYNCYPELNHNEMVGYTLPQAKFHIITLINPKENSQITKRMLHTAKLLKAKKIDTTFFELSGANNFEKMFDALLLGDWVSYYLSLSYRQDPTPVVMVEDFKKMLI
jgi:glucose/mannose-6-phosphate isomerase